MLREQPVKNYLIASLPEASRPREKLWAQGADNLSTEELLALILRSGPAGLSTLDVARDLVRTFDHSLLSLAAAEPGDLTRIRGIGQAKAAELAATFTLARRMANEMQPDRVQISQAEDAARYFREKLRGKKQEELHVLLLNTKNHVLRAREITRGLLNSSPIHPREVFRQAIQENAAAILLVHNHPSGDPTPSKADINSTKKIKDAGEIIGIELIDHVILGQKSEGRQQDFISFREAGLL